MTCSGAGHRVSGTGQGFRRLRDALFHAKAQSFANGIGGRVSGASGFPLRRQNVPDGGDGRGEEVAATGRRDPLALELQPNRPSGSRKVDVAGANSFAAVLTDDRVEAAQIRLGLRVGPSSLRQLELILNASAVAEEHEAAIFGDELLGWLLDAYQLGTVRNPAPKDHPHEAVGGFAQIARSVAGIDLADVGEVRADLGQEVGIGLRIGVATITWNRPQRGRAGVVIEDEMVVGEVVVAKGGIVPARDPQDRGAAWPAADEHRREFVGGQAGSGGALTDEFIEGGNVLSQAANDEIGAAGSPLRMVGCGGIGIEDMLGILPLFAQEDLPWPKQELPGLGHVEASGIGRGNVAGRDVIAGRCG